MASILETFRAFFQKNPPSPTSPNQATPTGGLPPPLPWAVQREQQGEFGFTRDSARVEQSLLADGSSAIIETVRGETAVHPGGDPDNPLLHATSAGQRWSVNDLTIHEVGQSMAAARFRPGISLITSGGYSVGNAPEQPKKP